MLRQQFVLNSMGAAPHLDCSASFLSASFSIDADDIQSVSSMGSIDRYPFYARSDLKQRMLPLPTEDNEASLTLFPEMEDDLDDLDDLDLYPKKCTPPSCFKGDMDVPRKAHKVEFDMSCEQSVSSHRRLPMVIATPVEDGPRTSYPSPSAPCTTCSTKDLTIQKQAKEIAELKALVASMVDLLGKATAAQAKPTCEAVGTQTEETVPEPEEETKCEPISTQTDTTEEDTLDDDATIMTQDSTSSASLRMSRVLDQRQQHKPRSSVRKSRHVPIHVPRVGEGFYSGPRLVPDVQLKGCVVRFEDGGLYLGDMRNYMFHGRGVYYPKGKSSLGDTGIQRGLFHKNKLVD